MATNLHKRTIKAVKAWCQSENIELIEQPRHVYPRAYVVGYASASCLVVAVPWVDSEPQCQELDKANPLTAVYTFDKTLKAGDWCSLAYLCTAVYGGTVAIPVVL